MGYQPWVFLLLCSQCGKGGPHPHEVLHVPFKQGKRTLFINIQNTDRWNYSALGSRVVLIYWLGSYVLILLLSCLSPFISRDWEKKLELCSKSFLLYSINTYLRFKNSCYVGGIFSHWLYFYWLCLPNFMTIWICTSEILNANI